MNCGKYDPGRLLSFLIPFSAPNTFLLAVSTRPGASAQRQSCAILSEARAHIDGGAKNSILTSSIGFLGATNTTKGIRGCSQLEDKFFREHCQISKRHSALFHLNIKKNSGTVMKQLVEQSFNQANTAVLNNVLHSAHLIILIHNVNLLK